MSKLEGVIALQSMVTELPRGIQIVQPMGTTLPLVGKMAVAPSSQPGNVGRPSTNYNIIIYQFVLSDGDGELNLIHTC